MLPVLDRVHRTGAVDLVRVGLVTGQAPATSPTRAKEAAQRKLPPGLEPKTVVNTHRMLHRGVGRLRGLGMGEAERRGRRASPAGPA